MGSVREEKRVTKGAIGMSDMEHRAWMRMTCVMTDEELGRFTFLGAANGTLALRGDLHGLSCREARRLLNNLMLLIRDDFDLVIIHGYRHGRAIKDMLRYDYDNRRLAARWDDKRNPGVTLFQVA